MSFVSRRQFLSTGVVIGATVSLSMSSLRATAANDVVHLGFIGCGGRASNLLTAFSAIPGVVVSGLCDPDESRLGAAGDRFPKAQRWRDLRGMLDDQSIDAAVISTCNHSHCLAAIWAMEAGKDVFVEKPLSHSQWEGQQTVAAARKFGRVCQLGTQQRSDPMQGEIKTFLHDEHALGKLQMVRVNHYGVCLPIGRRETPMRFASNVDCNLWLGPAQDLPIYRDQLHYDWHFDFNTGSGDMGNWGIHILDDVRNNVFLDTIRLPKRVFGGGGRVAFKDAGNTPNLHFCYFDTGSIPVVIGLSNLTTGESSQQEWKTKGPGTGYVVYGEGGRLDAFQRSEYRTVCRRWCRRGKPLPAT